jgi:hypothetical protein
MKTFLLNYSDDRFDYKGRRFRANQLRLNESAMVHGLHNIVSWTWQDLTETPFYRQHATLLDRNRFHNGALFKPYIILDLLQKVSDGDIVFYYDCGPYTIRRSIQPLIELCVNNRGTLFHQYGDQNRNWTKRDAFTYMDCDTTRYHNATSLQNTWLFVQRNEQNLEFIKQWLHYNADERIASYVMPDTCGLPPLPGFIQNRGDQSIFSNLAVKFAIRSFFGAGGPANRDINNFIASMPPDVFGRCRWSIRRRWIRFRRRISLKVNFAKIKDISLNSVN